MGGGSIGHRFHHHKWTMIGVIAIFLIVLFLSLEEVDAYGQFCRRRNAFGIEETYQCPGPFDKPKKAYCCPPSKPNKRCCDWDDAHKGTFADGLSAKGVFKSLLALILFILLLVVGVIACCCCCVCYLMKRRRQNTGNVISGGGMSGGNRGGGTSVVMVNDPASAGYPVPGGPSPYPMSSSYPPQGPPGAPPYPMQGPTAPVYPPPPYGHTQPPYNPHYQ